MVEKEGSQDTKFLSVLDILMALALQLDQSDHFSRHLEINP